MEALPITPELIGDYDDPEFRARFQAWINRRWADKDELMETLQAG